MQPRIVSKRKVTMNAELLDSLMQAVDDVH